MLVLDHHDPVQDGQSPPSQAAILVINTEGPFGKTVSRCFKYFATSPLRLSLHFQSWFEAIDIKCKTCTAWHHLRRTLLQNVFQQAYPTEACFGESNWKLQKVQRRRLPPNQLSTQSPFCNWAGLRIWQSSCRTNFQGHWRWHENKGQWPWRSKNTAFKMNMLTFPSFNINLHSNLWSFNLARNWISVEKTGATKSCPAAPKNFASGLRATRCLWTKVHISKQIWKNNEKV